MKKLIIFLLMMLPLGVFAQESKIAIVNTQEVIQAMPEFANMQKQMADMEAKYKSEMQVMEDEYKKKYSDFVAQQDSLTENIKMRRMQELQDMEQRTQNFIQISQQDFQKKQGELFTPIQDKLKMQSRQSVTKKDILIFWIRRLFFIRVTLQLTQLSS